jgi:hypothetical protein
MKNIVWLLLVVMGALSSCSKMEDTHMTYLNDGDLCYAGVPYDVVVISKESSVEVRFKKTADPNILKYIIYWNNRANSQDVNPSEDPVESVTIPNLAKGNYSFELIAVDKAGNKSKVVYAAGVVN